MGPVRCGLLGRTTSPVDVECFGNLSNRIWDGGGTMSTYGVSIAGQDAPPTLVIDTTALSLAAALVPWDTESFGVQVAQINSVEVRDPNQASIDLGVLTDWLAQSQIRLASCRLQSSKLRESFLLEMIGFRFVEMVYSMHLEIQPLSGLKSGESGRLKWTAATPDDLSELTRIAAISFTTGRWNVDWRVGERLAGRRYADWVERSLRDNRHEVLKAIIGDRIAGFFVAETRADGSVYWHLTAVAPEFQGHGVGREMWESMALRHASAGQRRVETTIAARNIPVINLYAKLGWRFMDCHMTLHWASPAWCSDTA